MKTGSIDHHQPRCLVEAWWRCGYGPRWRTCDSHWYGERYSAVSPGIEADACPSPSLSPSQERSCRRAGRKRFLVPVGPVSPSPVCAIATLIHSSQFSRKGKGRRQTKTSTFPCSPRRSIQGARSCPWRTVRGSIWIRAVLRESEGQSVPGHLYCVRREV